MLRKKVVSLILLTIFLLPNFAVAQSAVYTAPKADIDKIIDEGMNRSQVMDHLEYLTDVIGPRLTNSPGLKRANEWTRDTMKQWGMNARLESWGPFGHGWVLKNFSAALVAPYYQPLVAFPNAWTPPTNGPLTGELVYIDIQNDSDYDKYKGQLKGKILLVSDTRDLKADFDGFADRLTDKQLEKLAAAPDPKTIAASSLLNPDGTPTPAFAEQVKRFKRMAAMTRLVSQEGAAMVIENSPRGSGGTLMVHSAWFAPPKEVLTANPGMNGFSKGSEAYMTPHITMISEDYNRLVRMIKRGEKPKLTINIDSEYQDEDLMGYNTIAEIPGSDPKLKDELVMLGGHLDSWHASTGATDNAAGCAVAMEAVRILLAAGFKPRRTIRVALWTGEEQGLLGSKAYVAQQFGELKRTPGNSKATPPVPAKSEIIKGVNFDKLSVYFNLDNGTGKIRGIYMQGNNAARPIFEEWFKPFNSMGASTLTISNTTGTDHLSFDSIGLPGFQFIQDPIEYDSRTHHTNQDNYDRIQAGDMKQAATIMAAFVYQASMMDQKCPVSKIVGRWKTLNCSNAELFIGVFHHLKTGW